MKKTEVHLITACLANLVVIALIINYVWTSDSDKAIIILVVIYPVLTVLNLIIWVAMRLGKDPGYKIYRTTTIGLIVLFIPVISIAAAY